MEKAPIRWKVVTVWSVIGIVVVVGVILIIVFMARGGSSDTTAAANNDTSTAATAVTNSGSPAPANGQATQSGSSNIPAAPGPTITIHLLTPISGNVWTIGTANPIAWDNPAGVTGQIDLVDPVTKAPIGIILAETGPNQTSYTWNAEEVYRGRYSADEMAVVPGTYSIMIHFDGNGLGDLVSGPITITD